MYDEYDDHGILVQKYGPYFLNSNHYEVMRFLSRYAELIPHCVKMLSFIDGRYVRLPFNFETVQQLVGQEKAETLLDKLRKAFVGSAKCGTCRRRRSTRMCWNGCRVGAASRRTERRRTSLAGRAVPFPTPPG